MTSSIADGHSYHHTSRHVPQQIILSSGTLYVHDRLKEIVWPWGDFRKFPALTVLNAPDATNISTASLAANVSSQLSHPGQKVQFTWDQPGKKVGYNESFVTVTDTKKPPKVKILFSFVMRFYSLTCTFPTWICSSRFGSRNWTSRTRRSKMLHIILPVSVPFFVHHSNWLSSSICALLNLVTYQPGGTVYPSGDPIVNGSMFIALTDTDLFGSWNTSLWLQDDIRLTWFVHPQWHHSTSVHSMSMSWLGL